MISPPIWFILMRLGIPTLAIRRRSIDTMTLLVAAWVTACAGPMPLHHGSLASAPVAATPAQVVEQDLTITCSMRPLREADPATITIAADGAFSVTGAGQTSGWPQRRFAGRLQPNELGQLVAWLSEADFFTLTADAWGCVRPISDLPTTTLGQHYEPGRAYLTLTVTRGGTGWTIHHYTGCQPPDDQVSTALQEIESLILSIMTQAPQEVPPTLPPSLQDE